MNSPEKKIYSEKELSIYTHTSIKIAHNIGPGSILIMGQSRSGKSTSFNAINDPNTIIGTGTAGNPEYQVRNVTQFNPQMSIAEVKRGYKSVTIIPNQTTIAHQGKEYTLMDLPGFNDTRTKNEVILINFIIKSCFSYCQDTRFILVISDKEFTSNSGKQFRNLFLKFTSFFKWQELSEQQRQNLNKSVGIFVTSVRIQESYEVVKKEYLRKFVENLEFMQQMSEANKEMKASFPFIDALFKNIIDNSRLQLFQMAKLNQSPKEFDLLTRFEQGGWKQINLQSISAQLQTSYASQFKTLSEEDQIDLKETINLKVQKYFAFTKILAKIINKFIEDPMNKCLDYEEEYEQIEAFLEKHKITEDILVFPGQNQFLNTQVSSFDKLKCLIQSQSYCDNICDYYEQIEQNGKKMDYFQYLNHKIFIPSMQIFKKTFCQTKKQKFLLQTAINMLSQGFEQIKFISQIDELTYSSCRLRLKENILIMNNCRQILKDIITIFFSELLEEEDFEDNHDIEEVKQLILFAQDQYTSENINFKTLYQLNERLHSFMANKSQTSLEIIDHLLHCFANRVMLQFCNSLIKEKRREENIEESMYKVEADWKKSISSSILGEKILQTEGKFAANVCKVYEQCSFVDEVIQIYDNSIKKEKNNNKLQLKLMEELAQFYHRCGYKDSLVKQIDRIIKKLNSITPKDKERIKQNEEKKKMFQNAPMKDYDTRVKETKRKLEKINQHPYEHYFSFLRQIWAIVHPNLEFPYSNTIFATIYHSYENQIKIQKINSEFEISIPRNPTNSQIIKYSSFFINKIKNKKATIILGGKNSGKTTISYWIRNLPLISKRKENSFSYDLSPKCNEINRINHNGSNPTEILNICSLSEEEILIDFPSLMSADLYKQVIFRRLFIDILESCRNCRFILVLKEDDVQKSNASILIKWILLINKIFQSPDNFKTFTYVFSFVDNSDRTKLRNTIKRLQSDFSSKNRQNLYEIYSIDDLEIETCKHYLNSILNRYQTFQKASETEPKSTSLLNDSQNRSILDWNYIDMNTQKISQKFRLDCIKNKSQVEKKLLPQISRKWDFIKCFIKQFVKQILFSEPAKDQALRAKLFERQKIFFEKELNGTNFDTYYEKLKQNSTIKMIEIGTANIQRMNLPSEQRKLKNYLVYSRLYEIYDAEFDKRSLHLLKCMQNLLQQWSMIVCKNDDQFRIFVMGWTVFKSYLEELLMVVLFIYQNDQDNHKDISEVYQSLPDIWFNCTNFDLFGNSDFASYLRGFDIKEYEKEEKTDEHILFDFLQASISKISQLKQPDLKKILNLCESLVTSCEKYENHHQISKVYVLNLKVRREITNSPQMTNDESLPIQFFQIFKNLALSISNLNVKLSLRICAMLDCNTTRLAVFKNLASKEESEVAALMYEFLTESNTIKDDSYFCIVTLFKKIEKDEEKVNEIMKSSYITASASEDEDNKSKIALSYIQKTRDESSIIEEDNLLQEVDVFLSDKRS